MEKIEEHKMEVIHDGPILDEKKDVDMDIKDYENVEDKKDSDTDSDTDSDDEKDTSNNDGNGDDEKADDEKDTSNNDGNGDDEKADDEKDTSNSDGDGDDEKGDDEEDIKEDDEVKKREFLEHMRQKREAEESFKMFIKAMLMKKMSEQGLQGKVRIIEKEDNNSDSSDSDDSDDSDKDSDKDSDDECDKEKNKGESKIFINVDSIFMIFAGISLFNIFIFFYNMYCLEYYNDKIEGEKKLDFVYTIFQYVRDTFIFSIFEKIIYTLILLHILNMVIGMILSKILPKGGKKSGGSIGLGKMGGLANLFGEKGNDYKVEEKGKTGVTFKDVAGCHIAKKELLELIDFLQNREKYTKLGAQLPKGALLYGPSGTGKTMIAKALAHEVSYNYIYVQGSDFKKPLVGLGPQSVKDLFQTARKNAPCIIFIDEIDSFAKKRGSDPGSGGGSSHSEEDAVLNTFLAELDGFKERGDVFVMGATNRLSVIDDALLRPKRFDRIIHFKLPNVDERYEIIESYFNKMKVKSELNTPEYKKMLAKKSYGFSGAQIFNMCNEACILAGKESGEEVIEKHVHEALDYIHLGKTEEHIKAHLTDEEKRRTAYHETGHAIVAIVAKELENPTQISIVPHNKGSLGVTLTPINEHKYSRTREDYIARLAMLLGGRMAEEIFIGNISGGAKDDLNKFNALVDDYFNSGIEDIYLTDDNDYRSRKVKISEKYLEELEVKKRSFVTYVYEFTKQLLQDHNETIHTIAKELMEKEDMYEEDIEKYLVYKEKNK
jgi:ATP-dependent metalloprotease FtsH